MSDSPHVLIQLLLANTQDLDPKREAILGQEAAHPRPRAHAEEGLWPGAGHPTLSSYEGRRELLNS